MNTDTNHTPKSQQTAVSSRTYCLFDQRHDLPPNRGPVFNGYDWETRTGAYNSNFYEVQKSLLQGHTVWLYATGLQAALTQLIGDLAKNPRRNGSLIILHFDHKQQIYFPVTVLPATT